jgi:hypothetical protein
MSGAEEFCGGAAAVRVVRAIAAAITHLEECSAVIPFTSLLGI